MQTIKKYLSQQDAMLLNSLHFVRTGRQIESGNFNGPDRTMAAGYNIYFDQEFANN